MWWFPGFILSLPESADNFLLVSLKRRPWQAWRERVARVSSYNMYISNLWTSHFSFHNRQFANSSIDHPIAFHVRHPTFILFYHVQVTNKTRKIYSSYFNLLKMDRLQSVVNLILCYTTLANTIYKSWKNPILKHSRFYHIQSARVSFLSVAPALCCSRSELPMQKLWKLFLKFC